MAALTSLQTAQAAVSNARKDFETAVARILAAATSRSASSGSSSSSSGAAGSGQSGSSGQSGNSGSAGAGSAVAATSSGAGSQSGGQGGQGGGSTTVAQAAASVASARLALTNAQLALSRATMTAPISGTVSAVPFTVGDEASTSDSVDLIGGTGVTLSLSIGEDDIRSVKVGQQASVSSAAGSTSGGTVSAIGILPSSSTTTSDVSYPVTVEVMDPGSGLVPGTTASALVTIASAKGATLVPVSAVTLTDDSNGTVKVIGSDHRVTSTRVSVGAIGQTRVQITKGISAGATLAVADSASALPTSGSTSQGGGGMGGDQGGGGRGGGGAGGGGGQGPR